MSTYAVGEIAIFARPGSVHYGRECTVVAPLEERLVRTPAGLITERCYLIDGDFQRRKACPPEHLRKRRPPQDWVTLCSLDAVPAEPRELELA